VLSYVRIEEEECFSLAGKSGFTAVENSIAQIVFHNSVFGDCGNADNFCKIIHIFHRSVWKTVEIHVECGIYMGDKPVKREN